MPVSEPWSLDGWNFNAIVHPGRYAIVCLSFFTVIGLMVASVRRGRSGRRLLAVRTNERAAAALGISVIEAKVYAFALSAGIAAIGGTLLAFRKDVIIYKSEFLSFNSIVVAAGHSSVVSAICSVRSRAPRWRRAHSGHRSPTPSSPASPNGFSSLAVSSSFSSFC
ncbi:MAG: ABC-type branched-subunit amino acid transport system permease subunit [Acidimicrobiales bacterium]